MTRSATERRLIRRLALLATVIIFLAYQAEWAFPIIPLHVALAIWTSCLWLDDITGRARRHLRRVGIIASVFFLALWIATSVQFAFRVGSHSFIAVARGGVEVELYRGVDTEIRRIMSGFATNWPSGWSLGPHLPSLMAARQCFLISLRLPSYRRGDTYWGNKSLGVVRHQIVAPFWIAFALFAIPTGQMFWRDLRSSLPGHCSYCRYNLTGNTSGICPECGTAV